jgi:hypothetical protein
MSPLPPFPDSPLKIPSPIPSHSKSNGSSQAKSNKRKKMVVELKSRRKTITKVPTTLEGKTMHRRLGDKRNGDPEFFIVRKFI